MTRLPGHCDPRSSPENATAHTTPSRSTIVPHIWKSRPLLSACTAAISALLSVAYEGSPEQALRPLSASAHAADDATTRPKSSRHERLRFMLVSLSLNVLVVQTVPSTRRAGGYAGREDESTQAMNEPWVSTC